MVKKFVFSNGDTHDARNYYGDLGLEPGYWGESHIKITHKKLSLKWHPDRFSQPGHLAKTKEEAEKKFKEITEARDVLVAHESELRNLLSEGKGCRSVPKFECVGCHSQSSYLFKEHTEKNGTKLKYCNYFFFYSLLGSGSIMRMGLLLVE